MIVMLGEIFSNQNSRLITAKYVLKYLQHNKIGVYIHKLCKYLSKSILIFDKNNHHRD